MSVGAVLVGSESVSVSVVMDGYMRVGLRAGRKWVGDGSVWRPVVGVREVMMTSGGSLNRSNRVRMLACCIVSMAVLVMFDVAGVVDIVR